MRGEGAAIRRLLLVAALGWAAAAGAADQEWEEELLPLLSPWTTLYSVQAATGYKDNVLLSSFDRQSSSYLRGSADVFLSRFPADGRSVDIYLFWEHSQFLEDAGIEREQVGFAQAQLKRELGNMDLAGLEFHYSHQNQVVDVSVTEAELTTIQVRGHGVSGEPSYRAQLADCVWLRMGVPVLRQFFREPLDDYLEYGPRVSWGWNYGHDSEMDWVYAYVVREYDNYEELTEDGLALPDTERVFQQQEARWEWRHYWDEAKRWQSSTRLDWRRNEDRGSGYFDYHRYRVSHRLRYRAEPWTWSVRGRITHYRYEHQIVSMADTEKRRRTEYSMAVRLEREIAEHLSLYTEYDGEWIEGNIRSEEYRVGTVLAGMLWEF